MFGSFHINLGRKIYKRFVAVFICFSSGAIHSESTSDMNTVNPRISPRGLYMGLNRGEGLIRGWGLIGKIEN